MADTNDKSTVPDEGQSLWADAWKRMKKNRMAMIGLWFVLVVAIAGYSSPLIAEHITHFSLDEQHTRLKLKPPGTVDVSFDHPTYDGNPAWFSAVDLDGDGYISCTRVPQKTLVFPGQNYLKQVPDLYEKALASLDAIDAEIPIKSILAIKYGSLKCPELDMLKGATRFFDFFFEEYDKVPGDAEVGDKYQPDGFVTWKEFPKHDGELKPEFRGRGMSGPDFFRKLDINKDNVISNWETTERSRYLRFDKAKLIADHDQDRDLRISKAEFPGAPQLHTFYLGTDTQGRDVLTRLFYGGRISITIGLLATLVSLFIGVIYGATAGFLGGRVDNIMMRIVDVLYGLPYIFIVILLMVAVGRSTINLFIALGAVQWLNLARVTRGQVISIKTREFIEAARAVGTPTFTILFRHVIRNTVGPVIVYSTLLVPAVILSEAFLSFLGLGVQPPDPSWGNMITEGAQKIEDYTWLIIYPGAALALTLFSMNFLGDGLRDALDPKTQKN